MSDTAHSEVLSRVKREAVHLKHQESSQLLEKTALESGTKRAILIEKIVCDKKDVLSKKDIEEIKSALQQFLEVQERLGKAFFDNSNDFADVLWNVGAGSPFSE